MRLGPISEKMYTYLLPENNLRVRWRVQILVHLKRSSQQELRFSKINYNLTLVFALWVAHPSCGLFLVTTFSFSTSLALSITWTVVYHKQAVVSLVLKKSLPRSFWERWAFHRLNALCLVIGACIGVLHHLLNVTWNPWPPYRRSYIASCLRYSLVYIMKLYQSILPEYFWYNQSSSS